MSPDELQTLTALDAIINQGSARGHRCDR